MAHTPRRVAVMLDLQWPYKRHAQIFAGFQRFAVEQGWVTIIDEFPHDTLRRARAGSERYDGIVARAHHPLARRAAKLGVPVVNVWPSSPARHLLPGVFPDSAATGRLLAEHLLSRGFRSFATLTSIRNVDNELEVRELSRLVREAGCDCASAYVPQNPHRDIADWRKTERLIARAMDRWTRPVGVYVGQEVCGRLVVQLSHHRGWRIPDDVAIIAGKNEETLCEHPRPSLTSIEIGYDRIGYAAAELLGRLMAGRPTPTEPDRTDPVGPARPRRPGIDRLLRRRKRAGGGRLGVHRGEQSPADRPGRRRTGGGGRDADVAELLPGGDPAAGRDRNPPRHDRRSGFTGPIPLRGIARVSTRHRIAPVRLD